MRTVLANHSEVAHYWANHIQEEGRACNMFFENESIFSYGHHFEIARFVKHDIVFFNEESYSVSTSKHQSLTRRAIPSYCKVFYVASFDNHLTNIKNYLTQIEELQKKVAKARTMKAFYLDQCRNLVSAMKDYLETFEIKGLSKAEKTLIQKLTDNMDNLVPEELEKEIKEKELKERKARERAVQKKLKDWKAGKTNYISGGSFFAYLRIKDEKIQTSEGASVSIKAGKVLWDLIQAGRDIKGFKIEGFTVIGLKNKILKIGCHQIQMQEVSKLATQLQW